MRKSTNCGDWHLGWGYGGSDKIGKLSTEDGVSFEWKGYSQGRHGQKWNSGASVKFHYNEDGEIVEDERNGNIPRWSEIDKAAKELKLKIKS